MSNAATLLVSAAGPCVRNCSTPAVKVEPVRSDRRLRPRRFIGRALPSGFVCVTCQGPYTGLRRLDTPVDVLILRNCPSETKLRHVLARYGGAMGEGAMVVLYAPSFSPFRSSLKLRALFAEHGLHLTPRSKRLSDGMTLHVAHRCTVPVCATARQQEGWTRRRTACRRLQRMRSGSVQRNDNTTTPVAPSTQGAPKASPRPMILRRELHRLCDGDSDPFVFVRRPRRLCGPVSLVLLDAKLCRLRQSGRAPSLLDAARPGTWLGRLVTRAVELRFATINARGFDVAEAQIETARRMAGNLAPLPGVCLKFDVRRTDQPAERERRFGRFGALPLQCPSHLPVASLPSVASEIARVTRGYFITTVRAVGSTPTIFIDSIDKAWNFRLDHSRDRYHIELRNGRSIALRSHLFTARELRKAFSRHFEVEELSGLDIFHSRFMPDRRWNPASVLSDKQFLDLLAQLESS